MAGAILFGRLARRGPQAGARARAQCICGPSWDRGPFVRRPRSRTSPEQIKTAKAEGVAPGVVLADADMAPTAVSSRASELDRTGVQPPSASGAQARVRCRQPWSGRGRPPSRGWPNRRSQADLGQGPGRGAADRLTVALANRLQRSSVSRPKGRRQVADMSRQGAKQGRLPTARWPQKTVAERDFEVCISDGFERTAYPSGEDRRRAYPAAMST